MHTSIQFDPYVGKRNCRICRGKLYEFLKYEGVPRRVQHLNATDVHDDRNPLLIAECEECNTVQTMNDPPSYWKHGNRRSGGISAKMMEYRKRQFTKIFGKDIEKRAFVEYGETTHLGPHLSILRKMGVKERVKGMPPQEITGALTYSPGPTFSPSWPHHHYDAALCLSYLEHVPDPKALLQNMKKALKPGGIALIEVPNFEMMKKEGMWAEFMKDHVFYFTQETIHALVKSVGFVIKSCNETWDDYIITIEAYKRPLHTNYLEIDKFDIGKEKLLRSIEGKLELYQDVAIWGASHQAMMIVSQLSKKMQEHVKCVVDDNEEKQGNLSPGTNIPIVSRKTYKTMITSAIIVIAGSYSSEIVNSIIQGEGYGECGFEMLAKLFTIEDNEVKEVEIWNDKGTGI